MGRAAVTALTIDCARSFEVPAVWASNGVEYPDAVLTISRGLFDSWSVCVTPGPEWAPLWLADTPSVPWGRWRSRYTPVASFPTADAALDAAVSTAQIASVSTPDRSPA